MSDNFQLIKFFSNKYIYTGNNNIGEKNAVNIRYYKDEPDEAGPPIKGDA